MGSGGVGGRVGRGGGGEDGGVSALLPAEELRQRGGHPEARVLGQRPVDSAAIPCKRNEIGSYVGEAFVFGFSFLLKKKRESKIKSGRLVLLRAVLVPLLILLQ